jgi:hypothetical protein
MSRNRSSCIEKRSLRNRSDKRTERSCRPLLNGFADAVELELRLAPGGTPVISIVSQAVQASSMSDDDPADDPGAPPGTPTQDQTESGPPATSVTAQTSVSNTIIGSTEEVKEGVFQFTPEVNASEQGIGSTSLNIDPQEISISSSMQNIDSVSVVAPGTYTIQGGVSQYVETTTADGSYSTNVSNTTGLTVTVNLNLDLNASAPNFIDHVALNFASTHLNVHLGVNDLGGPQGLYYSDAATGGKMVQVPSYTTSGPWSISFTAPASSTETANYSSSLMTGPNGTFTEGGSPGGNYGQSLGFTWSFSVKLNT